MSRIKTPIFDLTIGTFDFGNDEKLSKLVNEIDVDLVSDGASSFKVVLDDREAPFSDLEKEIKEGMSVTIALGYGATGTDKLIEGIVTGVNTARKEFQRKTYVVTGYDGLQALTRGRKRRSWEEIKDSDIAGIIANECGLQPDTDDSEIIHPYVVQNNVTNLSFLMERAKRIGFEVKVEERRLVFKKPKRTEDCGVTLTWDGTKMNNADTSILQRCDFDTSTMGVVIPRRPSRSSARRKPSTAAPWAARRTPARPQQPTTPIPPSRSATSLSQARKRPKNSRSPSLTRRPAST